MEWTCQMPVGYTSEKNVDGKRGSGSLVASKFRVQVSQSPRHRRRGFFGFTLECFHVFTRPTQLKLARVSPPQRDKTPAPAIYRTRRGGDKIESIERG